MSLALLRRLTCAVSAAFLCASACGKDSESDSCVRGTEACVCYPNGTCNDGLECLSSLCVHREGTGGTATGQGGGNTDAGAGPEISGGSPTTEGGSPSGGVGHGGSASGGTNSASGGDSGGDSGGSGPEGEGGAVTGGVSSGGKAQGGSGGSSSGGFTGGAGAGGSAQGGKGGSGGSAQGGSGGAGKGGSGGAGGQGGTTGGVGGSAGQSGKGGSAGASPCGGAAGASTLFLDTFECGLNAWTQSVSGAFAIGLDGSNTLERATVATSLVTARAGDATWGNVRIEARVKALSFGNAQATSYVILYGHFVDANNYIAMAWQGDGTVAYRQRKNGGGSDTYNQATLLTTGQWYTFALELSADTAKGFVNGTLIHDTSLNPISTGRIAFGTANASARFDDVRVIQLP